MNTYQFVWARDTHTFSCHHNTEPTTSTTRADSSSDSSTGPLKARQRCSLEEAAAGEAGTEEGRALAPAPPTGLGGKGWSREKGEERRKPTKQTHLARESGTQPEAAGTPSEQRCAPGPAPPSSPGAEPTGPRHPPPAAQPARPTLRRLRSRSLRQGPPRRWGQPGPRGAYGDRQAETPRRRTSPEPALRQDPTAPPALTAAAVGPPPNQVRTAAPRRRHARPQPRRPRAHLALRGSSSPPPAPAAALRTPAAAAPQARRATPSQLWAGSRGFRTRRLGNGSREYEPGTQGRSRFFPTRRRQQQRRHQPVLLPGHPA